MDAIDNRNLALLRRCWNESDTEMRGSCPSTWAEGLLQFVLRAMRKAGDEALLDQVSVRLERSFGSTHDVRAGAQLVTGDDYDMRTLDSVPLQPIT